MLRLADRLLTALAAGAVVVYGLTMVPTTGLDASTGLPLVFGALAKLTGLWMATAVALSVCRAMAGDDPSARGWRWLTGGLAGFGAAQAVLAYHQLVLTVPIPFPSIADALFLGGSALLFLGLLSFLRAVPAAGFPFDWRRDFVQAGAVAAALGGVCSWLLLAPLLPIEQWDRAVMLTFAYPVADLVLLVPSILLLRVMLRFRSGRVSRPWIFLVAGMLLFLAGDILFAHLVHLGAERIEPVVDLLYVLSYLALGRAAVAQRRLLLGGEPSRG